MPRAARLPVHLATALLLSFTLVSAALREVWTSEELGLQLMAPAGWSLLAIGPLEAIMSPPAGAAKIAIFSLPIDDPGGADLDRIVEDAIDSQKEKFAKFKLLESRPVQVSEIPAHEIYFRGRLDGEKFHFVQTIFLRRDRRVIVMYMAPEDGYALHVGDYDGVLRSVSLSQDGG